MKFVESEPSWPRTNIIGSIWEWLSMSTREISRDYQPHLSAAYPARRLRCSRCSIWSAAMPRPTFVIFGSWLSSRSSRRAPVPPSH